MNFFCVKNVPNSGYIQFQEEGKVGGLFAGRNHLAHNRQFQRRQEKSRLPEDIACLTEVYSLPPLRDDEEARRCTDSGRSAHLSASPSAPALPLHVRPTHRTNC